jgi:hypothetical protein
MHSADGSMAALPQQDGGKPFQDKMGHLKGTINETGRSR